MKLRMEKKDQVIILSVLEDVQAEHPPVIGAGLQKLFQGHPKGVLLDLTQIGKVDDATLKELLGLRKVADEWANQLVVISDKPGVGDAPNEEEGIKKLDDSLSNLMNRENKLKARKEKLSQLRDRLKKQLEEMNAKFGDIRALRKENSDLKSKIQDMEQQVALFGKERKPLEKDPSADPKQKEIEETLKKVYQAVEYIPK